ncbi:MAG: hypothetical protein U5Q03_06070 [Bacteroidota bacterium]|nr:hypothetical protein [Bacteroidota bacterium]
MIKESIYRQASMLYDHMYKFNHEQGRQEDAMTYLILASNARDTLRILEKNLEAIEIQTKYETEQKGTGNSRAFSGKQIQGAPHQAKHHYFTGTFRLAGTDHPGFHPSVRATHTPHRAGTFPANAAKS